MFTADQAYLDAKDFPGVAIILGAYAKIILGAYAKKNRLRKRVQMPLDSGEARTGRDAPWGSFRFCQHRWAYEIRENRPC